MLGSNDVVILTLTPILCYFTQVGNMDPTPWIFAEFFAANLLSFVLVVGNPTNIIVAQAYKLSFLEFSKWTLVSAMVVVVEG